MIAEAGDHLPSGFASQPPSAPIRLAEEGHPGLDKTEEPGQAPAADADRVLTTSSPPRSTLAARPGERRARPRSADRHGAFEAAATSAATRNARAVATHSVASPPSPHTTSHPERVRAPSTSEHRPSRTRLSTTRSPCQFSSRAVPAMVEARAGDRCIAAPGGSDSPQSHLPTVTEDAARAEPKPDRADFGRSDEEPCSVACAKSHPTRSPTPFEKCDGAGRSAHVILGCRGPAGHAELSRRSQRARQSLGLSLEPQDRTRREEVGAKVLVEPAAGRSH